MRLGIDLGTCLSSAAVLVGDELKLIKDPIKLGYSFPSSVYLSERGEVLVGHAADNNRRKDPGRYKREFKRDWGVKEPYTLGEREMLPEELAAEVLRKLRVEADKIIDGQGVNFTTALVTVPANYQAHKRRLVKQAGRAAGFDHVETLEEPAAAAIYYAWAGGTVAEDEIILVYDLGGGTFDAALIQRQGNGYELLAPPVGLEHCGGVDFDRKIYEDLKSRCSDQLREILDPTRRDLEALRARAIVADFCRDLKHQLSEAQEAEDEILLPRFEPETYRLTRAHFNTLIEPLLEETAEVCRQLVRGAGLTFEQIKGVLLVGGSCRTPYVREVVERLGRPVFWVEDPELAVCKGAAVYGAELDRETSDAQTLQPAAQPVVRPSGNIAPSVSTEKEAPADPPPSQPLAPPETGSLVVSVSGDGTYRTIGEAMAAAPEGARILVKPGVYREGLSIDRRLEIEGDGSVESVVVESVAAPCLTSRAGDGVVRGLTLRLRAAASGRSFSCVDISGGQLTLERCDVTSDSLACVSIHGENANPTVRACTIHDGSQGGIFVFDRARAIIEDCQIYSNAYSGIDVTGGGDPIVRRCSIRSNRQCGICVFDNGRGTAEDCEIRGNTISGVMIRQGGDPTIRACRIFDGAQSGITVSVNGAGRVEGCDIYANMLSGVEIKKGGDPVISRCRIHDGRREGITVKEGGRGTVEECEVFANALGQVVVQPGTTPVLRSNRVREQAPGAGTFAPTVTVPSADFSSQPALPPSVVAPQPPAGPPAIASAPIVPPPPAPPPPAPPPVVQNLPPSGALQPFAIEPPLLVAEQFALLCRDEATGNLMTEPRFVRYGLNAAVLGELLLLDRMIWQQNGVLMVKNPAPIGNVTLDFVLRVAAGMSGNVNVGQWVRGLDEMWGYRRGIVETVFVVLAKRGLLAQREVGPEAPFDPLHFSTANPMARQHLVASMRAGVFGQQPFDERGAAVFALLRCTGSLLSVLTPDEAVRQREAIEAVDRANPLGPALAHVVTSVISEDIRASQGLFRTT